MKQLDADVCVVGAASPDVGTPGDCARRASRSSCSRRGTRVGGRTWAVSTSTTGRTSTTVARGSVRDRTGRTPLAAEMGRATYAQYVAGDNVFVEKGKPRRYAGSTPLRVNPLQLASVGIAMSRLDRMAKQVPLERPWEAKKARVLGLADGWPLDHVQRAGKQRRARWSPTS